VPHGDRPPAASTAPARAYRDALKKSQDDESKGLFGMGFGPS
jgi:hypothetical protein